MLIICFVINLQTGEVVKVYCGADNDVVMSLTLYQGLLITGNRRGGIEALPVEGSPSSATYLCQVLNILKFECIIAGYVI